jgi:hypothetical protein
MRALECDRTCVLLIDELDKVADGFVEAMPLEILSAGHVTEPDCCRLFSSSTCR